MESHVAAIAPVPQPVTQPTPEPKPSPPAEGGLQVDTIPAGATVIVDGGSIIKTSPATFSNLAIGRHHLQIVRPDYLTEEREVEVKEGQIAAQGVITLRSSIPPQPSPTADAVQEALNQMEGRKDIFGVAPNSQRSAQKENEQKVAAPKKPTRSKQPVAAPTEKPAAAITRQPAATPPPPKKIAPKPAATPQRPFEGGVPGG